MQYEKLFVSWADGVVWYCCGTYSGRYIVCGSQHTAFVSSIPYFSQKCGRAEWRLMHGLTVSLWGHMKIFLKGLIKLGIVTKAKQFCDFINIHFGGKQ